jgi:hypothetical protein
MGVFLPSEESGGWRCFSFSGVLHAVGSEEAATWLALTAPQRFACLHTAVASSSTCGAQCTGKEACLTTAARLCLSDMSPSVVQGLWPPACACTTPVSALSTPTSPQVGRLNGDGACLGQSARTGTLLVQGLLVVAKDPHVRACWDTRFGCQNDALMLQTSAAGLPTAMHRSLHRAMCRQSLEPAGISGPCLAPLALIYR